MLHQAVVFALLSLESSDTSNGSYLHQPGIKTAIKPANQPIGHRQKPTDLLHKK